MTDTTVIAMFTPGGVTIHRTRDCLGPAKDSPYAQEIPMPPADELTYEYGNDCGYCGKPLADLPAGEVCPVAAEYGMDDQEHVAPDVHEGYYVHECLR